uniref:Uncharacterized protein n=1 Tax=Romanomermis culicivorax TaxID=13658 RepID=A0A915L553_ROMCU
MNYYGAFVIAYFVGCLPLGTLNTQDKLLSLRMLKYDKTNDKHNNAHDKNKKPRMNLSQHYQ